MNEKPNNNSSLAYVAWLVLVLGVLAAFFVFLGNIPEYTPRSSTATLLVQFNFENRRMFEGPIVEGMTVLGVLEASSRAGNFDYRYVPTDNGDFLLIVTENSQPNSSGGGVSSARILYLNGEALPASKLGTTVVSRGDIIEIRAE